MGGKCNIDNCKNSYAICRGCPGEEEHKRSEAEACERPAPSGQTDLKDGATMTDITDKYRERLTANANDFDGIVADMLQEMEGLHIELKAIHDVIMCIAEAKPSEDDTYTVAEVKRLAGRVVELQNRINELEECEKTLKLARQIDRCGVDEKTISEWAETLAADISGHEAMKTEKE